MQLCPDCKRHHKESETNCPFCGASRRRVGSIERAFAVGVSAIILAACYGSAPFDDTGFDMDGGGDNPVDADNDGYSVDEDCDDTDASINPGEVEICDDEVDNDCDDAIDEDDSDCVTR